MSRSSETRFVNVVAIPAAQEIGLLAEQLGEGVSEIVDGCLPVPSWLLGNKREKRAEQGT